MSNENSTTNLPRRRTGLQRVTSGRHRAFMCITYLDKVQLNAVLLHHLNQVRIYAYALHDKDTYEDDVVDKDSGEVLHQKGDLKEEHYHILLLLYNANTLTAIRRWFYGWKDEKGEEINTLVQVSRDKYSSFDYLTHNTPECKRQGKNIYPSDIVVCNDLKHFQGHCSADLDNSTICLMDLIAGVPYEQLVYRYGRDFIMNHQKYIDMACLMYRNENFKPKDWGIYDNEVYGSRPVDFAEKVTTYVP